MAMPPDPYASGDVGIIPGVMMYLLFAWISRAQKKKISKTEEKALSIFMHLTLFLAFVPWHLMIGLMIVGALVLASPITEALAGINTKTLVRTYIWVDGQISSFVWTIVIGAIPSSIPILKDIMGYQEKPRNRQLK